MARKLRYIAEPGTLVETTCRIMQGRMLLRPSRTFNEMIVGTFAAAKQRYGVRIVCAVVLSNHLHLLLEVDSAKQLADFQGYIASKIAKEIRRATGWSERIWGRRYASITVSDEPEVQIARLRYLLSHGVKENLVARCVDWPGVHAAGSLLTGEPLVGYWFDRSAESAARQRNENCGFYTHARFESLSFDALPCWRDLDEAKYRTRIAELVEDIEATALADRERRGVEPLGTEAILLQDPQAKPGIIERSPAPLVHTTSRAVRRAFREAYRLFVMAYRIAAKRLLAGEQSVCFPAGCFPPALAFVDL